MQLFHFNVDELVAAGYEGFAMYAGNAMIPVKVNIEGDYSEFYYDFYGNDLTDTEDYPDDIFYEYLWDGAPYESASFFLPFDKVMTVVAVAYDDMRNPSHLYREVVCFSKEGCSTVEEYEAMQGGATRSYSANNVLLSKLAPAKAMRTESINLESKSLSTTRSEIIAKRKAKFDIEIASKLAKKGNTSRFVAR